jgi:Chloramphenicol phosphotransferase-like protein
MADDPGAACALSSEDAPHVSSVVFLSGPIGAGKTTIAQELIAIWSGPLVYIEGDKFWSFLVRRKDGDQREDFRLLMRAITAASLPFARSGYDVLLDFSVPPPFLKVALAILKDMPLDYVLLRPSLAVCAARARDRQHGKITKYDRGFYALFDAADHHTIADDDADAASMAQQIRAGLAANRFRVSTAA